ncbi:MULTISPECIES: hypothetical protein [unclassified Cobetia]|uniref:hypothetical protein n=1 Tax=unclassified Cobetia TaxID=2609414 RepID=UPI00178D04CB|nr:MULTISPECIES: hypothetical protein [unclassified Cobetia]MBE2167357.1 hypothetical protein [Cobetia sp. 2AS1]MDH2447199.1 hypothetical protein [Cobetia sp. 2AS]
MDEVKKWVLVDDGCQLETEWVCDILVLFQDDSQYVTWFLVFVGWVITALIAYLQFKKSDESSNSISHNEWVREFREKLEVLEDNALIFWTNKAKAEDDLITLEKLIRSIKEITTIAGDIEKVGGVEYPKETFMELRRAITSDTELEDRPLPTHHSRPESIVRYSKSLRRLYRRKCS